MAIKIYGDPGSGSLRRVTSAAAIMGVDIERVYVDLFKGESHAPDFLKNLNPHGLTPVMVDGDVVLYEASAINILPRGEGWQRPARRHAARAVRSAAVDVLVG
jgi:glutathione S-transferase